MAKRRIFNYRPLAAIALALVAGIAIGEALYSQNIALIAVPISAAALAVVLLSVFKKTRRFVIVPVFLLVGFAAMSISNAIYDARIDYVGENFKIEGATATVDSEISYDGSKTSFYVTDIYVGGKKLNYDGRVYVYYAFEPDFSAGDIIAFDGYIKGSEHVPFDGFYASAVAQGRAYYINPTKFYKVGDGSPSFPRNLQLKIKSVYDEVLDKQTAMIAKALVLGDKFGMNEDLKQGISASGLSHVLAVSGLHITTLATALYFLLKKLKVKPIVGFAIVTVLTFLYTMLCSFTASALRAFIMSGVFNASSIFGKKRDNISACAFAAILILIFRPTALMEMGFLFSFASMIGIFVFFKSFNDVAMKIVKKISPKRMIGSKVASLMCVTLSATMMSYPLIAFYFGKLPLLMIVSNLVFVPYIMVVYVLLLALTVFALVTTLHAVLVVAGALLYPFKSYVNWVGGLTTNALALPVINVAGVVCYAAVALFASRLNLMSRRDKVKGGFIAVAAAIVVSGAFALI